MNPNRWKRSATTKAIPRMKSRMPTLWTRSYYCESAGHISEETVRKYIEEQKNE
jgi:putative transposase